MPLRMTRPRGLWTSLGLLTSIALSACATTSSERPWTKLDQVPLTFTEPVVVPLIQDGAESRPVVGLKLNGHECRFLVDTLSALSFVVPECAEEVGLTIGPVALPDGSAAIVRSGTGKSVRIDHYGGVKCLELGSVAIEDAVLFLNGDAPMLRSKEFQGVLGYDLLKRLPVVFDLEHHALHFLPPGTDRAGIEAYLTAERFGAGGWSCGAIEFDGGFYVPITVDGALDPMVLMFDTGCNVTALPEAFVTKLGLETADDELHELNFVGGTVMVRHYRWEFELMGFRMNTTVPTLPREFAILGMNALGNFNFVLDGPGKMLWLRPILVEPATDAAPAQAR